MEGILQLPLCSLTKSQRLWILAEGVQRERLAGFPLCFLPAQKAEQQWHNLSPFVPLWRDTLRERLQARGILNRLPFSI
ncbi:MAG: hypothetical protein VB100_12915 [Angelakisella sp.]|nr:hypothetical protein [Angelakisella sp.]